MINIVEIFASHRSLLVLHLAEVLELQHLDVAGLVELDDALLAVDGQQGSGQLAIFA